MSSTAHTSTHCTVRWERGLMPGERRNQETVTDESSERREAEKPVNVGTGGEEEGGREGGR